MESCSHGLWDPSAPTARLIFVLSLCQLARTPHGAFTAGRLKPRVATLSPSTSSGVMCPPRLRRSSSAAGLRSAWLLRDFSLFRTPPAALRSRWGAAAPCPPPETLSATGASPRALAPLIVGSNLGPTSARCKCLKKRKMAP